MSRNLLTLPTVCLSLFCCRTVYAENANLGESHLTVVLTANLFEQSAVSVQVTIKNTGKETAQYVAKGYASNFQFSVTDKDDHVVPFTQFGRQTLLQQVPLGEPDYLTRGISGSCMNVIISLKPGMETAFEVPIDRLFDLSRPGVYQIKVTTVADGVEYFISKLHPRPAKPPVPFVLVSNTLRIRHDAKGYLLAL